jgi:DNA-binding transcriptional regulator YdaS (Cro superfamily)
MRTAEVIEHFGSQAAVARALNIKPPSVAEWGETVPPLRQLQIEKITGGVLKAAPEIAQPGPAPSEQAA